MADTSPEIDALDDAIEAIGDLPRYRSDASDLVYESGVAEGRAQALKVLRELRAECAASIPDWRIEGADAFALDYREVVQILAVEQRQTSLDDDSTYLTQRANGDRTANYPGYLLMHPHDAYRSNPSLLNP